MQGQAAPTPEKERRHWATLAARALLQAGERELVVRLMLGLGLFKQARALLQGMNDPRRLADCCLAAADTLRRQGQPDTAVPWLGECKGGVGVAGARQVDCLAL